MLILEIIIGLAEVVAKISWAFIGVYVLQRIIKKKPIIEIHKEE